MNFYYSMGIALVVLFIIYRGMKTYQNKTQYFIDGLIQDGRVSMIDGILFINRDLDDKSIRQLKYISQNEKWEAVVESEIDSEKYKKLKVMVEEFPNLGVKVKNLDMVTDKIFAEFAREYSLLVKKAALTDIAKTATK